MNRRQFYVVPDSPISFLLNDSASNTAYRIVSCPLFGTLSTKSCNQLILTGTYLTYFPGAIISMNDTFEYSNESYVCDVLPVVRSSILFIYPNLSIPMNPIFVSNGTILSDLVSFGDFPSNLTMQVFLFTSNGQFNSTRNPYLGLNGTVVSIQQTLARTSLSLNSTTIHPADGLRIELFGGQVYTYVYYQPIPSRAIPAPITSTVGLDVIYFLVMMGVFALGLITFMFAYRKRQKRIERALLRTKT